MDLKMGTKVMIGKRLLWLMGHPSTAYQSTNQMRTLAMVHEKYLVGNEKSLLMLWYSKVIGVLVDFGE